VIEIVSVNNLAEILPLIRMYQEFYESDAISDQKNHAFFSQFHPQSPLGCQFLYRQQDEAVAFATVYFSFSSVLTEKVAILNDLYTRPDMRKRGIGRQLLEHCREFSMARGAARLQWLTAADNQRAQGLYDSFAVKKSPWIFYSYTGDA